MAFGQQRPGAPREDDDDLSSLLAQADRILSGGQAAPPDDLDTLLAEADRILGTTPAAPTRRQRATEAADIATSAGITGALDPTFMPEYRGPGARFSGPLPVRGVGDPPSVAGSAPIVEPTPAPSVIDLVARKREEKNPRRWGLPVEPPLAPMKPVASHTPRQPLGPGDISADVVGDTVQFAGRPAISHVPGDAEAAADTATAEAIAAQQTPGAIAKRAITNPVRSLGAGTFRLFTSGFWGTLRAASETMGIDSLAEFARDAGTQATEMAAGIRGDQEGAGPNEKAIYGGFESIGLSAPAIAAGALTGSPQVALGLMGAATAGESYADARNKGVDIPQALAYATSQGAIEIATEKIPASRLLADLAKKTGFMQMIMRQLVAEIPTEQAATVLQDLNDWVVLNPDKPFSSYLAERPGAFQQTLISTIVATIGQSAGAAAIERLTRGEALGLEEMEPSASQAPTGTLPVTIAAGSPDTQQTVAPPRLPVESQAVTTPPTEDVDTLLAQADEILAGQTLSNQIAAQRVEQAAQVRGTPEDVPANPVAQQLEAERQAAAAKPLDMAALLAEADQIIATPVREPGAESTTEGVPAVSTAAKPGEFYTLKPQDIEVDPARFQFKAGGNTEGVTSSAKIEGPWNEARAGVLMVWKDPADGKTYVVNGHHRLEAAKRLGAERVAVRYVDAPSAEMARVEGALTNISEDKGTPLDGAKLIRDAGFTIEELTAHGLSAKSALVRDAVGLSNLSDPIFERVVSGEIDEHIGGAIGAADLTPEGQGALVKIIERQQGKGRTLSPAQVRTLAQDVANTPEVKAGSADGQTDIFGLLGDERTQNVAVEKAVLRDWARQQLAKDKRLFGFVLKEGRAEALARAGNTIDVEASKAIADEAGQVAAVFDRLAHAAGPVSGALNAAAVRIAEGQAANDVRKQLLEELRDAVTAELRGPAAKTDAGTKGAGPEVRQGAHRERRAPDPEPRQPDRVADAPAQGAADDVGAKQHAGFEAAGDALTTLQRQYPDRRFRVRSVRVSGGPPRAVVEVHSTPEGWRLATREALGTADTPTDDIRSFLAGRVDTKPPASSPKASLQIRPTTYRDRPGFQVVGKDPKGRNVKVFTESRGSAEVIKARIAAGEDPTADDFKDPAKAKPAREEDVALPGAEAVRDVEHATPPVADLPFALSREASRRDEHQPSLGLPVDPPTKTKSRVDEMFDGYSFGERVVLPSRPASVPSVGTLVEEVEGKGRVVFNDGTEALVSKGEIAGVLAHQDSAQRQANLDRASTFSPAPVDPPRSSKKGGTTLGESVPPGAETPEQFGARLLAHVKANLPAYVTEYRQRFGSVINGDNASELFPEYVADRAANERTVRPAAAKVVDAAYARMLEEPVPAGQQPIVVFTSGGNGSGKSTALPEARTAHIVVDSTMTLFEPTMAKIDAALAAGHDVRIRHTSRHPVAAWTQGVLPRAATTGRTVRLSGHAFSHRQARQTLLKLADHYAGNPRVQIAVRESGQDRKPITRSLDWLRQQQYPEGDDLRAQLQAGLDAAHAAGTISDAIYDGATGVAGGARANRPGDGRGVREEPRPRPREPRQEVTAGLPVDPTPTAGSPTRAVFDRPPQDVGAQHRGGRPMSEQQAVNELRDIFAVTRTGSSDIMERLGVPDTAPLPTRTGKFPQRAFGIYNTEGQSIRLKRAFDLATFTHELGHHIDFALFETHGRPVGLFKAELLKMGEATTPASKVGKDKQYQMQEGVAEFFRMWFSDPAAARTAAPAFSAALDAVMAKEPVLSKQLHAGQRVVQRYLSQDLTTRGKARVNVHRGASPKRVVANAVAAAKEGASGRESVKRVVGSVLDTLNISKAARDPHAAWQAFRKRWVDDLDPIRRAVADMASRLEDGALTVWQNAYVLARLARGTAGRAQGFIEHGVRNADGQFLGGSLRAAIEPVADRLVPDETGKDTRPDLASYLIALRARELSKPDRPGGQKDPGMKPTEAAAIIQEMRADPEFERFETARKAIYAYQRSLLAYAREAGVFNDDQLTAIAKAGEYYVPLQRVLDEVDAAGASGTSRRIADRVSPVKRLKGSGRDIIDPFESIVKNTAVIVDMVEKNRAMQALANLADKAEGSAQWLEKVPPGQVATTFNLGQVKKEVLQQLFEKTGISPLEAEMNDIFDWDAMVTAFAPQTWGNPQDRIVTVIRKGKREFYQVQDEALYQAITAIGPAAASEIVQWAAKPTSVLRAGATLTPAFIIRNLIRDTVGAMMQSRHGFIPVYDSLRGFVSMMKNDADWQLYMASGVQQATLLGQDRDRLKSVVDKLGQPKWRRAIRTAAHPLDALRALSEQIENATRVGEFKLALDTGGRERRGGVLGMAQRLASAGTARPTINREGVTTATLAARDVTVDFSRGGSTSKEISQFKAFFNARAQGYARIAESIKRDPTGSALTVGALAALSWALWSMNKDDEEYQSLTWRERMDYWWFKLPGNDTWFRVAKPHEWGTVPNLVEGALEQVHHEQKGTVWSMSPVNLESRDAMAIVASLAPTFILPAMEAATNYDTYRRKHIVSPFDEMNLKPVDQYTDLTSETMKAIGRASGLSPAKLEHMFVGYTASAGRAALDLSDTVLSGRIKPREVARRAEQWPVAGTLLKDRSATSYAQPIQDFYREREALQQTKGSFKLRAEKGDREGFDALRSDARGFTAEHVARIEMADEAITDLRELRNGIYANKALTPLQRREALAGIHQAMVRWAATATFSDTKFENIYKTPKPPWQ